MTKSDLKYGNVVEIRNGGKYLFTYYDEEDIFVNLTGDGYYYLSGLNFNNYKNSDIVIMKVYKDFTLKELLWERKEKPKLTEDERVILRNINKKFKYITRDKNGRLYVWRNEPIKNRDEFWTDGSGRDFCLDYLFQFIKWEDEEPYLIEDLLELEND